VPQKRTIIGALCLVLVACARPPVQRLPVEEVLARAARESQRVESVAFSGDVLLTYASPDREDWMKEVTGEAQISGVSQNGGAQVALEADVVLRSTANTDGGELRGTVQIVVASPTETYVRIENIRDDSASTFLPQDILEGISGVWWLLPSDGTEAFGTSVTPDPQIINAQSQVVRVSEDKGFATVDGHTTYHYVTAIDPEKLVTYFSELSLEEGGLEFDPQALRTFVEESDAQGELWIDAESFLLRRVEWSVNAVPLGPERMLSLRFSIDLTDQGSGAPVTIPKGAKPMGLSLPVSPAQSMMEGDMVQPELDDAFMQQLIDEGIVPSLPAS